MDNQERFFRVAFPKFVSGGSFMAYYLYEYGLAEKISQEQLMQKYNLSFHQMKRLALCKAPIPDSADFNHVVREVSDYSKVDFMLIMQIIKRVMYKNKFGNIINERGGNMLLAAAREKKDLDDMRHASPTDD